MNKKKISLSVLMIVLVLANTINAAASVGSTSVFTGDKTNVTPFIILAVCCIGIVIFLLVFGKGSKQEDSASSVQDSTATIQGVDNAFMSQDMQQMENATEDQNDVADNATEDQNL